MLRAGGSGRSGRGHRHGAPDPVLRLALAGAARRPLGELHRVLPEDPAHPAAGGHRPPCGGGRLGELGRHLRAVLAQQHLVRSGARGDRRRAVAEVDLRGVGVDEVEEPGAEGVHDLDGGAELGLHLEDPTLRSVLGLDLELAPGDAEDGDQRAVADLQARQRRRAALRGRQDGHLGGEDDRGSGDHPVRRRGARERVVVDPQGGRVDREGGVLPGHGDRGGRRDLVQPQVLARGWVVGPAVHGHREAARRRLRAAALALAAAVLGDGLRGRGEQGQRGEGDDDGRGGSSPGPAGPSGLAGLAGLGGGGHGGSW